MKTRSQSRASRRSAGVVDPQKPNVVNKKPKRNEPLPRPFDRIPDHVLCHIFSFIEYPSEKIALDAVCKRFAKCAKQGLAWKFNTSLELEDDTFGEVIKRIPLVTHLNADLGDLGEQNVGYREWIKREIMSQDWLEKYGSKLRLTHVKLSIDEHEQDFDIEFAVWCLKKSSDTLKTLKICTTSGSHIEPAPEIFAALMQCKSLRNISFKCECACFNLSETTLVEALEGKRLQKIKLSDVVGVSTDDIVQILNSMPPDAKFKSLEHTHNYGIDSEGFVPFNLDYFCEAINTCVKESFEYLGLEMFGPHMTALANLPLVFPNLKKAWLSIYSRATEAATLSHQIYKFIANADGKSLELELHMHRNDEDHAYEDELWPLLRKGTAKDKGIQLKQCQENNYRLVKGNINVSLSVDTDDDLGEFDTEEDHEEDLLNKIDIHAE